MRHGSLFSGIGGFDLAAVIGCPSFGVIKLFLEIVCKFKNIM
jgi:hypothetical protein